MSQDCRSVIVDEIRREGPVTVARFMELALYHPDHGYYARAAQRSGRDGDFFTSVDVGRVFGELLAEQFCEMWRIVRAHESGPAIDLVEAGAGNGRLAADIAETAAAHDPDFYHAINLGLVERSPAARAAQADVLGPHRPKLTSSAPTLPDRIHGILYANELLDAMPTHLVFMRDTLREVYVDWDGERLVEREDAPSTPELQAYLDRAQVRLEPGWRVEISLDAARWVRDASRRLDRGFLLLIDYGHDAKQLYASTHSAGTLTTYRRHVANPGDAPDAESPWLADPGSVDMTSHVDLTTVQRVAEAEGLETLAILDQTYFLLGLVSRPGESWHQSRSAAPGWQGARSAHIGNMPATSNAARRDAPPGNDAANHRDGTLSLADRLVRYSEAPGDGVEALHALKARLALKTLMMPGGLGSVQKVMIFGKGVGRPALRGCSYKVRVT